MLWNAFFAGWNASAIRSSQNTQKPAEYRNVCGLRSRYALTTLPLRKQDVHTRMRLVAAPTRA